jgi:hypothetical protein
MSKLLILPSTLTTQDKGHVIIDHGDGVKEDISKDEVHLKIDYDDVRKKREEKEKEIKENSLAYGNISDDKLIGVERDLFGEELKEKEKKIKEAGPMGANGARVGFSRRDRETLQTSNEEINPFIKYQKRDFIQGGAVREFTDIKENYKEELEEGTHIKDIKIKNEKREKFDKVKKINFSDVLEMTARDTFGLMGGNMREDLSEYVKNYKKEYTENNINSISGIDNPTGRFRGGHERTQFITQAQNNKKFVNNDVVIDKPKRINIDSYFTSYNNTKNNTEVDKDNKYEREENKNEGIDKNNKSYRNRLSLLL